MKLSFLYGATIGTLVRLFFEHKGRIGFKHIPSFIIHLLIGIFNGILSIPDFFWPSKGIPKNIVFVLGHYRSGTTHLLNLLAEDGAYTPVTTYQAVFPGSFLTFEKVLSPVLNKIGPGVRAMDNMAMRMESPQEEEIALAALGAPTPYLAVHFPETGTFYEECISFDKASKKQLNRWKRKHMKFVRKLVKKHGRDVTLILKSPANTARIPILLELYPESKFVHIHRNPYKTIQSSLHLYDTWYGMNNFQSIEELKANRNQIVLDVFELLNRKWLEDEHLIPAANKISISFSELQADRVETVNKIYNHLGAPQLDKQRLQTYIDSIKSYKKNSYEALTTELVEQINSQLDFVFEAFEYHKI
jgi:hypothetical protein